MLAGFWLVLPSGDTNARLSGKRKGEANFCLWQWWQVQGRAEHVRSGSGGALDAVVATAKAWIVLFQRLWLLPLFPEFSMKQTFLVLFQPFQIC